ncbi:hypothetical protein BsWGS_13992 [Bradybaena similaris]
MHLWMFLGIVMSSFQTDMAVQWNRINLLQSHMPFFFANNPDLKLMCEQDVTCPFKDALNLTRCWGYEKTCPTSNRLSNPDCSGDSRHWVQTKKEQLEKFWTTADFGLVMARRAEMTTFCQALQQDDSSLECCRYLRYCRARNIYIDFTTAGILHGTDRNRYREDILGPNHIGGHCKLDVSGLKAEGEHKSPLQSWFAELEHFASLNFFPSKGEGCDIVFDKPTYLIKLDAGINMYHHFCDFVNLYASQHMNNSFDTNVTIIMWDTSPVPYGDFFSQTWKAFTDHPVIPLRDLDGKKICIKDAVFPLLARMRFGLYYNMPLMPGCHGSSLIKAFSEHVLYRLGVRQSGPLRDKIRITLLVRGTKYRNIMNQVELASAMKTDGEFEVTVVDFNKDVPFLNQLQVSHNSDIFIGMHGSGLTHMLFQPDWAVVMEIYNCEDPGCYLDLARLRGIHYMTWEKKEKLIQEDEGHHPTMGAHAKFTNYAFDVSEFMRLIYKAAFHVRNHPAFQRAREEKYGSLKDDQETGKFYRSEL